MVTCLNSIPAAKLKSLGMQEFLQRLKTVLRQFPPPQPKKPAVDLLVAVGDQQQYLLENGLSPPPGSEGALDALQVSSLEFVRRSEYPNIVDLISEWLTAAPTSPWALVALSPSECVEVSGQSPCS